MQEPGLHRSLFADYLASALSGLIVVYLLRTLW